jgi:hypothetical protein
MQGNASVSNNTASFSFGGGVRFMGEGTFTKKGGTIYGDTDTTHTAGSNENTAASGNGHAVYALSKKRNTDAGSSVMLYAASTDGGGSWTYNDTSPGGVGDTTANWE